jgi:hypothetical protein
VGWDWVHLVRWPLIGLLYQPQVIDDAECGAVIGMRVGRGIRSTRRKPAPVPLCPPQIPDDLTWARSRAAAVGSRRLISWATARPVPTASSHCAYCYGWLGSGAAITLAYLIHSVWNERHYIIQETKWCRYERNFWCEGNATTKCRLNYLGCKFLDLVFLYDGSR